MFGETQCQRFGDVKPAAPVRIGQEEEHFASRETL